MSSSSSTGPANFMDLSEKDQRCKTRKRHLIEKHWQCPIDRVLPPAIRPRNTPGRTKAKMGAQASEAEWWRWSADLLTKLETFASMTAGRLPFAQALLQAEVGQRQKDYSNNNREIAEVLKADVIRVIEELRERVAGGYRSQEDYDSDEDGNLEARESRQKDGDKVHEAESSRSQREASEQIESFSAPSQIKTKAEQDEEGGDGTPSLKRKSSERGPLAAKRRNSGAVNQASVTKEGLEMRANIASMRAAASRLREQAAQREAKAYKLEAEMFEREAGEVE